LEEPEKRRRPVRILVIEDEPGIAHFIRQGLSEVGYAVDVTQDGQAGLEYALTATYDVIILDLLLPQFDGLHLLSTLRDRKLPVPVLVLTARDTIEDRVQGLDSGADDYLVKPFAFSELLARLRALLRRPPLQAQTVLRVCDLEFDTARREVRRAGRRIDLSPRELSLLEFLLRHQGQVLTRTQIAEHIWNFNFYNESKVLDVYIGYLRRKIDKGFERSLIQTVRGVGYRIDAGGKDA